MRAFVTGADGLLGSHLVRQLLERDFTVRAYLLPGSASPVLADLAIERIEGDLLQAEALDKAIKGCEIVFHCAALTDLWADPQKVWQVNLEGTRNVIDACLHHKIKRLIFTGSASSFQFGSMEKPGDETGALPREYAGIAYMESKSAAMKLVQQAVAERDLDAVTVAPTFMLGDLDFRPSSGELIRQFLQRGLRFASPGGRNFAYAPDVAQALIAAVDKGVAGQCYIAGGQNVNYFDFFTKTAQIAGDAKQPLFTLPGPLVLAGGAGGSLYGRLTGKRAAIDLTMARLSLLGTYYSSAKAVRELGMPQTPLEIGIEQSIRSLRNFGHLKRGKG